MSVMLEDAHSGGRAEGTSTVFETHSTRGVASSATQSDPESGSSASSDESEGDAFQNDSDLEEGSSQAYLNSLLEQARQNARAKKIADDAQNSRSFADGDDVLRLEAEPELVPLPPLNPGRMFPAYIETSGAGPSTLRNPDVALAEKASERLTVPAPPAPPSILLSKKQRQALRAKTAGKDWFDLPAPADSDLPGLYREVEALRLRNQLDPKRFYRKDEGEGKGIKGLPKHFAIGSIVATKNPFGNGTGDSLSRASRKRTLVDELVDDAEAQTYAKKKFRELQAARGARGRGTLARKMAGRKPKW